MMRPLPPSSRRLPLVGLLALALLLAQLLGLAHRHLHHWDLPQGQAVAAEAQQPPPHAEGLARLLTALFGEHADEASCRLYDQAASGESGSCVALGLPACPAGGLQAWAPRTAVAIAGAMAFQARAPPLPG